MSDLQKSYENLVNAIVFTACFDFRKAKRKGDADKMQQMERWLRSPWAAYLMGDLDPEYIIERLRNEA